MKRIASERTIKKSKEPFQFKTVSFGDSTQDVPLSAGPQRADMPFIITQNGKNSSEDASLIKRTVMQDFVSKEKSQVARRSRKSQLRQHSAGLPQLIRPRGGHGPIEAATTSQTAISPEDGESPQGYTVIENGNLISFDIRIGSGDSSHAAVVDNNLRSLLGPLGAGRLDPFDTFPIPNTWLNNQLLDHFCGIIAPALIPLPFTNTQSPLKAIWARNTLNDAFMFLGILVVAAAHVEVLRGEAQTEEARSAEVLYYEAELARILISRLNDPTQAISDSTITTVTCLAACEAFRGNLRQLDHHMKGLEKMVEMRGDLTKLGMRGLLQMTISWVDLTRAASKGTNPIFPPVKCTNSISNEIFKSMKPKFSVTGKRPDGRVVFKIPRNFPHIFQNVQLLSLMLGAARETRGADYESVFFFCNMRFYLEHRLLGGVQEERRTSEQFVRELTRLATLIYLHRVLREFQPSMGVLRCLKSQLVTIFHEAEISNTLNLHTSQDTELHETLLWILFCAGTVWLTEADKAWFSKRIVEQVVRLELRSWEEVEGILMRYLWMKGMCKEKAGELWREVEALGSAGKWMEILGL